MALPTASLVCVIGAFVFGTAAKAEEGAFLAFSLREANALVEADQLETPDLRVLGGISRISGMVFDDKNADIILIGKTYPDLPPITLDDLVVGLRTRLSSLDYPKVSIDITAQTQETGQQDVRLIGGIEDTKFGYDFFQSDVVLKLYSLGLLQEVEGLKPFTDLYADQEKSRLNAEGTIVDAVEWLPSDKAAEVIAASKGGQVESSETIQSRFWFHVLDDQSRVLQRENVYVIEELSIGVSEETEILGTAGDETNGKGEQVDISSEFSDKFTERFLQVGAQNPVLFRLKALFDIVSVCEGIAHLGSTRPDLSSLIEDFVVVPHETPDQYELVQRVGVLKQDGDTKTMVQLSGGIDLEATLLALEDGDVSALLDVVLASRPTPSSLTWPIPISNWEMPNERKDIGLSQLANASPVLDRELGFSLQIDTINLATDASAQSSGSFEEFTPLRASAPLVADPLDIVVSSVPLNQNSITNETVSLGGAEVGGVLLASKALQVDKNGRPVVSNDMDFSLISDGGGSGISEDDYQRFVTALWAVYFGTERPGVSIDPVAPGVIDEHIVRYIGNVVNSDLGRVMRDADYQMKKWAVGTETPDIEGFKDVDTIQADLKIDAGNVGRRFWFVPETLKFRQSDHALLFDGGQMKLRTEHDLERYGLPPLDSDRAFVNFFNSNYQELADQYPIFSELQDYGKMVALAGFLKDKKVPLLWFLQSNAHLIKTEDAVWTVKELAKDSLSDPGEKIYGGVDFGALARLAQEPQLRSVVLRNAARSTEIAFVQSDWTEDHTEYKIVPTRSKAGKVDKAGRVFHTDIALRTQSGEPGIEVVRYFDPARATDGEFGSGWHLLKPYSIEFLSGHNTEFMNASLKTHVIVTSHPTGVAETLEFSPDEYAIAGWIPKDPEASRLIGLFVLTDGSSRLVTKLGSEFHFAPDELMTQVFYSNTYRYNVNYTGTGALVPDGIHYELQPIGREMSRVANVEVPTEFTVSIPEHGIQETFRFSETSDYAGWEPAFGDNSIFRFLGLISDGSFRLIDQEEREIIFDGAGNYRGLLLPPDQRMITSIETDDQIVDFRHTIDRRGQMVISSIAVKDHTVSYERDPEGALVDLSLVSQ